MASGVGWAFVYVEALTLAQRLAGDDVMSRVFGVMESSMMASQSLGALAVPLLIVAFGPMAAIVACGVVFGVVVAIAAPTLDPGGPPRPEPRSPAARDARRADVRTAVGDGPRTAHDELDDVEIEAGRRS